MNISKLFGKRTCCYYMDPVLALGAAFTLELVAAAVVFLLPESSSTFSKANVPSPKIDSKLCSLDPVPFRVLLDPPFPRLLSVDQFSS